MPTVTIAPANQDAWIANILSGMLILILAIPMLIMATKFTDMTFNEYFEVILGKPIGKFINFIYALFMVIIGLFTIILLSDFLLSAVIPETPIYVILLFMLLPCMYATYTGIECIGRSSIILSTFTISIVILYTILNINNMDFKELLPILKDSTFSNLAYGVFNTASRFSDCFIFFTLLPYVKEDKKKSATKILIIIVAGFTLINTVVTLTTLTTLGANLAKTFRFPYFISIQQINLFGIIQRIEFFNVIAWINIFFFKLTSIIFVTSHIFSQIFKTKSYKPFIIPINLVLYLIITFTSISYYATFRKVLIDYIYLVIFAVNFVIPTMILIVYFIRRKQLKTTLE
jgi:spore germination protein KB